MARINSKSTRGVSRVKTVGTTVNPHGEKSFVRDARSELFFATVTSFNEDTAYEDANSRAERIKNLITRDKIYRDTDFLTGLVGWLRNEAGLRTIPSVVAVEAVHMRLKKGIDGGNREIIRSAIGRLDETADILAYWVSRYGKTVPSAVKRGIADALNSKLSEFSYMKWSGRMERGNFSLVDVMNIAHPKPKNDYMSNLFAEIIDSRYNKVSDAENRGLYMIVARKNFLALSRDEQLKLLEKPRKGKAIIKEAGLTHEVIAGAVGEITPKIWLNLLPTLGYNALVMNLRRMENTGDVSLLSAVAEAVTNAEAVKRSKIMPLAIMSAYRAVTSRVLRDALSRALEVSLENVPMFDGHSLILVDTSGSMNFPMSAKSTATRYDIATIFGAALALRSENATLVSFASNNKKVPVRDGDTPAGLVGRITLAGLASRIPNFCDGTLTGKAIDDNYVKGVHDRIIIITDETTNTSWGGRGISVADALKKVKVPVYTWNVAGYKDAHAEEGENRYSFAGLNDKAFSTLSMIENGVAEKFPWE